MRWRHGRERTAERTISVHSLASIWLFSSIVRMDLPHSQVVGVAGGCRLPPRESPGRRHQMVSDADLAVRLPTTRRNAGGQ